LAPQDTSLKKYWNEVKLILIAIISVSIPYIITFGINIGIFYVIDSLAEFIGLSGHWISTILQFVSGSLVAPFYSCIMVLIYFNLRIEKEGFDVEHLVNQFSLPDNQEE
jgi:energy-coupling factor transporter transmembrane protein EcfT